MSSDVLFDIANTAALCGWLVLVAARFIPRIADLVAGVAIPLALSVLYTGLALAHFGEAQGGFGSLAEVVLLFSQPQIVLLGWVHYLAFDLVVGAWEVRTARTERIPFLLVVPCLALTFLLGPAGFLLFALLRLGRRVAAGRPVPA